MSNPAPPTSLSGLSAVKLALMAKQARLQVGAVARAEPIAIVGMGCRFPGGVDSPEAYWALLRDAVDAVAPMPRDRWARWGGDDLYDPDPASPGKIAAREGGFLDRPDLFDANFFGIQRREAEQMDPQHRVFLEVAIDALDRAGLSREHLAGSLTGVFVASYYNDYQQLLYGDPESMDARSLTGTQHSVLANRLSYLLDLRGPSVSVDTACSSSLVAAHLACQSLRAGDSDIALAAGVSLMLAPETMIALSKVGFMSPSGRCRTFDASADGFIRGEGCGVVVLKRLADAISDNDPILGVIRGSAINQDGHSTVLTAPNGLAQQALVKSALAGAQLAPERVGFVEMHGTATPLGDPIEIEALAATVGTRRADGGRCYLGSAKANLGHLEAAAGVAGLIKATLVLQHGVIPRQPHFTKLNPHLSLSGTSLAVADRSTPWPAGAQPRVAGVSGFGVGGTNAHVLVEEAPVLPAAEVPDTSKEPQLLVMSAQSEPALRALAQKWSEFLPHSEETVARLTGTAGARRSHYDHRLAIVGRTREQLATQLSSFARGDDTTIAVGQRLRGGAPRVAFVFSGQGAQWARMGTELAEREPVFRDVLGDVDRRFERLAGWSVAAAMADSAKSSGLQETMVAQPAIFAIQVALTALWESWGVRPVAVVGHSVGEIAALYVAGVLSLDDALRIVWHRGRIMQRATGSGRMVQASITPAQAEGLIRDVGSALSIAALNGPKSVVLSGTGVALDRALTVLNSHNVAHRSLGVPYAFHSQAMAPYQTELTGALGQIAARSARIAVYSTVTGAPIEHTRIDAAYFGRNVRDTVRFAPAIQSMLEAGNDAFVEIAPHPVLGMSVVECAAARQQTVPVVASMRRERPERETMLQGVASLYAAGVTPNWSVVTPLATSPAELPSYPWQRESYWLRERPKLAVTSTSAITTPGDALLGDRRVVPGGETSFAAAWPNPQLAWLDDHVIAGRTLMPAAAMIEVLRRAVTIERPQDSAIADFIVHQPLVLESSTEIGAWRTVVSRNGTDASVELRSSADDDDGTLIASARGTQARQPGSAVDEDLAALNGAAWRDDTKALYAAFHDHGVRFGPAFRTIARWRAAHGVVEAWLQVVDHAGVNGLHPTLLDGALQLSVIGARSLTPGDGLPDAVFLPMGVESYTLAARPSGKLRAVVRVAESSREAASLLATVRLYDESGALVALLDGVRCARANATALNALATADRSTYEVRWSAPHDERKPQSEVIDASGAWIVLAGDDVTGAAIVEAIGAAHGRCLVIAPGQATQRSEMGLTAASGDSDALTAAVADDRWRGGLPLRGVVHAWSLATERTDDAPPRAMSHDDWLTSGSGLALVQAIGHLDEGAPLWFITRGAQAAAGQVTHAVQAGVWGLASVVVVEQPDLRCHAIDLDPLARAQDVGPLMRELVAGHARSMRLALRGTEHLSPRIVRYGTSDHAVPTHARLEPEPSGTLDALAWQPSSPRAPGRGEVRIRVLAAGVNFRDVLIALRMYPGSGAAMGAECAGIVEEVGADVGDFKVDDIVFAFAPAGLATDVTLPAHYVSCVPDGLSIEQAAALPAAFLTAMYGLRRVAHIAPGRRVLIHAAAGGVGLAAVQVAQQSGAEVFATAGSPAKRALLTRLGVQHVFDSRSLAFADQIRAVTKGLGVDIVLNSLADDFIAASVSTVARGGWFIELGKRGIWTPQQMKASRPDIQYRAFDLGEELASDEALAPSLMRDLRDGLASGALRPLPVQTFDFANAADAFRFMAQARHVGKLVLRAPAIGMPDTRRPLIRTDATYWITGGTGAIGVRTARWLTELGARDIVLTSRSEPTAEARRLIDECIAAGARVHLRIADAGDLAAMTAVRDEVVATLPPLRGVIHASGVIDDGVLAQQSWDRWRGVLHAKAHGARILDALTRDARLDFFVLYSSASVFLGPLGQGAYPAANAELDALAWERRGAGLPALSVAWGQWAGAGMAARTVASGADGWNERGLGWLESSEAFARLERLLRDRATYAAVLPIDWTRFLSRLPTGLDRAFYRSVAPAAAPSRAVISSAAGSPSTATPTASVIDEWRAAPAGDRRSLMIGYLAQRARHVIGIDDGVPLDPQAPLKDAGLDSLMAVELRNLLTRSLGRSLSATLLFDYPSLDALAAHLTGVLGLTDKAPSPPIEPARAKPPRVDRPAADSNKAVAETDLAEMSDAEAEALLLAELERGA